jgi:hypothetical protein
MLHPHRSAGSPSSCAQAAALARPSIRNSSGSLTLNPQSRHASNTNNEPVSITPSRSRTQVTERLLRQSVVCRELVRQNTKGRRMITEIGQAMAVAIGETTARRNPEIEVGRRRAEMAVSHKDVMAMVFAKTTSTQGSTPLPSPPATASYLSRAPPPPPPPPPPHAPAFTSVLSGVPASDNGLRRQHHQSSHSEPGSSGQTSAITSSALRRMATMSTGLGVWTVTTKEGAWRVR